MNQSSMQFAWMLQASVLFAYFFFIVVALVYTVVNRRRCPKPAGLLTWALALMLLSQVGGLILRIVLGKSLSVSQLAMAFQFVSALQMCLSAVALVLIVKAVFAERQPARPFVDGLSREGRPLADQPSDNPYASPRQ
jgi:hypothetical protein